MPRILKIIIFVFFTASVAWGHPPTDVHVTYDTQKQILHVEMTHVTSDMTRHYIRKIIVTLNQTEIVHQTLAKQTTPRNLSMDFPLKAGPHDVITVKVFCKQGGSAEGTMTVPVPEKEEKKP